MKKDIGKEIRENILKYTPLLRNPLYKLNKAADHLENWVNGVLDLHPLLDVSGCLGFVYGNCRLCTKRCKRPMSFLGAFFCHSTLGQLFLESFLAARSVLRCVVESRFRAGPTSDVAPVAESFEASENLLSKLELVQHCF